MPESRGASPDARRFPKLRVASLLRFAFLFHLQKAIQRTAQLVHPHELHRGPSRGFRPPRFTQAVELIFRNREFHIPPDDALDEALTRLILPPAFNQVHEPCNGGGGSLALVALKQMQGETDRLSADINRGFNPHRLSPFIPRAPAIRLRIEPTIPRWT